MSVRAFCIRCGADVEARENEIAGIAARLFVDCDRCAVTIRATVAPYFENATRPTPPTALEVAEASVRRRRRH